MAQAAMFLPEPRIRSGFLIMFRLPPGFIPPVRDKTLLKEAQLSIERANTQSLVFRTGRSGGHLQIKAQVGYGHPAEESLRPTNGRMWLSLTAADLPPHLSTDN